MVDDYFAEGWPGVSEGVHAFMLHQRGSHVEEMESPAEKLVPFFIGFNKVLLAAEDFASSYQDALLSRQHLIGLVTSNHKTPHRSLTSNHTTPHMSLLSDNPAPLSRPSDVHLQWLPRGCWTWLMGTHDGGTGDGTMKVKMQLMFKHPVVVMTEEVHCRKKTRGLLPGEQCPAGFQCS